MAQITLAEGAAPSTPATGKLAIYAKTDSVLYTKDDAGTETAISGTATETTAGMVELASLSEVTGTHTTGSITSGTAALTVASGTGINNGDYVVAEGITPGTKVSSGGGTTSITLSANANAPLSSDPVSFYRADRACSPGVLAGMLASVWVNFNGTGTVAIRAGRNVLSVTDNGVGLFVINAVSALADGNVAYMGLSSDDNVSATQVGFNHVTQGVPTASAFPVNLINSAAALVDRSFIFVAVFR